MKETHKFFSSWVLILTSQGLIIGKYILCTYYYCRQQTRRCLVQDDFFLKDRLKNELLFTF